MKVQTIKKILIKINETKNIIVSEDNTLLLTINASASISFLTGGIFCSIFNNIPTFNFICGTPKYRYYLNKKKLGKCHIEKGNCRNAKNESDLYRELSLLKKNFYKREMKFFGKGEYFLILIGDFFPIIFK